MITDRTIGDIAQAEYLRRRLQNGETLTNEEIEALEKGTCTVTMLNRIEGKMSELQNLLGGYCYMTAFSTSTWYEYEIFTNQDHSRILNNLDKLKKAFFVYADTPDTPVYMFGYREANDVERILEDIERMANSMISNFRQCGITECGGV